MHPHVRKQNQLGKLVLIILKTFYKLHKQQCLRIKFFIVTDVDGNEVKVSPMYMNSVHKNALKYKNVLSFIFYIQ